ncbi:protein 3a [Bean leafroll virus]|nr:protein 3a [Bean leafroll virus]
MGSFDYKFLAAFVLGFVSNIPVTALGIYIVYQRILKEIREIINDGR